MQPKSFLKKQHRGKQEVQKEKELRRTKITAKAHVAEHAHPKFPPKHIVEGTIRVNAKGVGYVSIEGMKDDIEIEGSDLNCALDRDRVSIILHGKPSNG